MTKEARKVTVAKKAARLRELADKFKATTDSSTALHIARDIRETSRELRELTSPPESRKARK